MALERADAVDAIEALVRSLPGESAKIRRLFWRDPDFRDICEDYRDCLDARSRFQSADPPDLVKAEEYRELAEELLAEAAAILRKERS